MYYENITKQFKKHIIECVIDSLDDYEGAGFFDFILDDEIYFLTYYSRCNEFIKNSGCNIWDVISFASELHKDMTGEPIPTDNLNAEYIVNFIFNHLAHEVKYDLEDKFINSLDSKDWEELHEIKKEVSEYLENELTESNKVPF